MTLALTRGCVYTGDSVLERSAVIIRDGRITAVTDSVPTDAERVDVEGLLAAPGFIDMQVNGGGGVLFNSDPTAEALRVIAAAHERFGTLHLCPTVISADIGTMERCLRAVGETAGEDTGILGAHLEGPYLSQEKPGVHDTRHIRKADSAELNRLLAIGHISLVTLAPEAVSHAHIRRLTEAGIRVFLGHTNATAAAARQAFAAGANGVTHLYNAMSQLSGREPGVVGAAFAEETVWAGIIADGIHTDWLSVRIARQIKTSRLCLVTDAMPPVGKPDAVYTIGKEEIRCREGRCATDAGTLAGSALDMATAVRNCVRHCGIALDEALRMASAYPAGALGLSDRLGYIRPGYAADLVLLDKELRVAGTVRGGVLTRR